MKKLTVFLFLASSVFGAEAVLAQWSRVRVVDGYDMAYGMAIGKGRNDDTVRVYMGGDTPSRPALYEATYRSNTWEAAPAYYDYVGYLLVENARNDSVQRVYSIGLGSPKEFEYAGGSWNRDTLPYPSGGSLRMACGFGRNDGLKRLYASGYEDGHMYEYSYEVDRWLMRDMGACGGGAFLKGVVLGQGRNDGVVRVYTAHLNGHVYEYSDSSGVWQVVDMGTIVPGVLLNGGIAIGDGRNDGVQRIYVSVDTLGPSDKGIIAEYSYEGGNWVIRRVGDNWLWFWPVAVGKGRNDTVSRVYAASVDNHVYEFSYSSGQWIKADVGVGETQIYWMRDVTVGVGRGDGVNRVYAVNDADLYEFSWNGSGVETGKEIKELVAMDRLRVHPNPFCNKTTLEYYLRIGGGVNVRIYDCLGREVKRVIEAVQAAGWQRIEWDGRDGEGRLLPAGVYFCQLVSKGEKKESSQTVKLVLTR